MIDVLFPVRPTPKDLPATLRALNMQTFRGWRLIALLDRDDGRNRDLISRYIVSNPISFVECDYSLTGFPYMLNQGLELCTADFVARQDDDDISQPERFDTQLRLMSRDSSVGLVTGFAQAIDENGLPIYTIEQPESPDELARQLLRVNIVPHSSVLMRRNLIADLGGYNIKMRGCEDYDLWLRVAAVSRIRSTRSIVLNYLINPEGMSRTQIKGREILALNKQKLITGKKMGAPIWVSAGGAWLWTLEQILLRFRLLRR